MDFKNEKQKSMDILYKSFEDKELQLNEETKFYRKIAINTNYGKV